MLIFIGIEKTPQSVYKGLTSESVETPVQKGSDSGRPPGSLPFQGDTRYGLRDELILK